MPNNIEIKDISCSSFNLSWKININNNINNFNFDSNKVKFKVEIRKEKEEFLQVYEGNKNECLIQNLSSNTNYELRICSCYNNFNGFWTEIQKTKTNNFDFNVDSIILDESKRKNEFLEKIYEWTGYKKIKLIYRGTRDGVNAKMFHNKCDNQGPTICLYKNEKENIFGGYASISWTNINGFRYSAPNSFLFTLTNIYNIKPTKFQSKNDQKEVLHNSECGPSFGAGTDLGIYNDFIKNGAWTYFPSTYIDNLGKGKSIFTGELNKDEFKLKEIEVFKIM